MFYRLWRCRGVLLVYLFQKHCFNGIHQSRAPETDPIKALVAGFASTAAKAPFPRFIDTALNGLVNVSNRLLSWIDRS